MGGVYEGGRLLVRLLVAQPLQAGSEALFERLTVRSEHLGYVQVVLYLLGCWHNHAGVRCPRCR